MTLLIFREHSRVTAHNEYMIDFTGISLITTLSILILNELIDNDAMLVGLFNAY